MGRRASFHRRQQALHFQSAAQVLVVAGQCLQHSPPSNELGVKDNLHRAAPKRRRVFGYSWTRSASTGQGGGIMSKLPRRSCAGLALGFCLLWGLWQGAFGAEPIAKVGTLAKITVHGESLDGNLSGDSADRGVHVYLPPSYATTRKRRYPVVYFLHGFGATAERYLQFLALPASIDRAIGAGKLQDMIFVMPNAMTQYGGSMYSDSITTGDWEAFVARDLVTYIDAHYRSIPRREARGLAGHSMGGYGTLRIGMKYSDTFGALYSMSGCCLDPRGAGPADAARKAGHRG